MVEFNWIADLIINVPDNVDREEFLAGLEDRVNAYIERRGGKALGTFSIIEAKYGEEEEDQ